VRLLALTYGPPWVADRGARIRDRELLSRLAVHHELTVLAIGHGDMPRPPSALGAVQHAEAVALGRLPDPLRARSLAAAPYVGRGALRRVARAGRFDAVQVEHAFLAPYARVADAPRRVLSLHNVGADQYASMARGAGPGVARAGYRAKRTLVARLERRHVPRFDRVVVVSEAERAALRRLVPSAQPVVVPNGADLSAPVAPELDGPDVLLFVGSMDYAPNADAALRLARDVLPLVPGAEAWVAGVSPPAALRELPGVRVLGVLDTLAQAYAAARVVVVPLRAGGGTRLKVLEALAHGRAVVSTPLGCAGLGVRDGREVLLACDDEGLAAATRRLLADPGLRARLAAGGRAYVEREHGWDRCAEPLLALYAELGR
jgi:glycosyltransferase involved in cell wall biosynthesis